MPPAPPDPDPAHHPSPAPHLALPPTDRVRSPLTGWTRAHWEALADRLLDALEPYATPGLAQYRLPGRASWSGVVSDGLEGYARSFLLAACRIAGAGGKVGPRYVERYAAGLTAGTDPDAGRRPGAAGAGEAWPRITDCSQQMVEAASIAIALHETRPWIWDQLDARAQERVVDWFSGFVGGRTHDNNWRLFQVVSEQFLASVGAPYRRADIEEGLDRIEDWYRGDGWYSDGYGRNFDYYNGWAMHLYPLLWCRMATGRTTATPAASPTATEAPTTTEGETGKAPDPTGGRAPVYRERLAQFLRTYQQFFGGDGAPVHQGRSLTYRFAAVAPVWIGALADCSPLPAGRTRRLASGAARHFVERGVPDERGLLPLGWYGTFLPVTQAYSGPASPYWASKGFLGLLLPPEHPVWTEREVPLPVEESDQVTAVPAPGWLLHGTRHDGIVRLINHGSDHNPPEGPARDDPHYAKLAYSTATAPEAAAHAWSRAVDNHCALLTPSGASSRRVRIRPLHCGDDRSASLSEEQLPDSEKVFPIRTTSVAHGPWEIRVHRVTAPTGSTVREGGYAVAGAVRPVVEAGSGWASVRTNAGLTSAVVGLYGWDEEAGTVREVGANAFGPHSATPYLMCKAHPGGDSLHVTLVALSQDAVHPAAVRESISCAVAGDSVRILFPDGDTLSI